MGGEPVAVWHADADLHGRDAVILPGGFSYGDYLRTGAIARFAPVMEAVREFAEAGGPVLGVCNGFQILCEAGLLPGALIRNAGLSFVCRWVNVRVESAPSDALIGAAARCCRSRSSTARGSSSPRPRTLARLEERRAGGASLLLARRAWSTRRSTPNGTTHDIAGLRNERGQRAGPDAAPRARRRPRPRAHRRPSPSSRGCSRCAAPRSPRDRRPPMAEEPAASARSGSPTTSSRRSWRRSGARRTAPSSRCSPPCGRSTARTSRRKVHLRTLPTEGPQVLVGPGQDAGVVDLGEGMAVRVQDRVALAPDARSSRSRARPPASAGSSATSCRWARGRRRCSTRSGSGRSTRRATGTSSPASWRGSAATATRIGVPTVGGEVKFAACYSGNPTVNVHLPGVRRTDAILPVAGAAARGTSWC